MSRKGQSITLSVSERDKSELEAIARELGMLWGDRPNVSKLIEAVARRQLLIAPNNDWSKVRLEALLASVRTLIDAGKIEAALVIANLLLERSELPLPLRREVERFLENPPPTWRLEIDHYIYRQQPFQLSYQDAADRLWRFTVRCADITPHEERKYLDCWCEETEGNQDLPDLVHNWSLRLDRITEATVVPIEGEWRSRLDQIEVEMHLLGGLAFAYQAKSEDVVDEWLERRIRRVVRWVPSQYLSVKKLGMTFTYDVSKASAMPPEQI